MALCNSFARKIIKLTNLKNLSTAAQAVQIQDDVLPTFRTKENNPANHNTQHLGKYYTLPTNDVTTIMGDSPEPYGAMKRQMKTFAELSILVRKPAVEIINYLNNTDYTKPVNKYVLYGDKGTGKSLSLLHVLHYAYTTNKLIIYVPWAQRFFRLPIEVANSESKEGFVDLPLDAAKWLLNFKNLNAHILAKADIRLSKTYEWGIDESFAKDAPITEIINFGINRVKYACDVVSTLFTELKQASTAGKCNILVAIDGYNAFYSINTRVRDDNKKYVPASKVTLTHAFLDLTKTDWCNGQIVITVDHTATKDYRESYLPRYLLTKEGFDHLDPFLPIHVENYTQDEFDTVIEYFKNRKWIRNITPEGEKELKLISGSNPLKLAQYCTHL